MQVGLRHIQLDQAATTLSGGEAQRVKHASELSKRDTGQTLYVLVEPTIGLHSRDIEQPLKVLVELRERGHNVVVIEHNLDLIRTADSVVGGGRIVAVGTPEEVALVEGSHTERFLGRAVYAK